MWTGIVRATRGRSTAILGIARRAGTARRRGIGRRWRVAVVEAQLRGAQRARIEIIPEGTPHPRWDEISDYSRDLFINADTIVIGGKTAVDFIPYWDTAATQPGGNPSTWVD